MATQISINTDAAARIYSDATKKIDEIRQEVTALAALIEKLPTEGEWKGDAANRFFDEYDAVKDTITKSVPECLDMMAKNLDTNLKNLVEADQAGTR